MGSFIFYLSSLERALTRSGRWRKGVVWILVGRERIGDAATHVARSAEGLCACLLVEFVRWCLGRKDGTYVMKGERER